MTTLAEELRDATQALTAARHIDLSARYGLMLTEHCLAQTKALAEIEIVDAAGGEKKLGSNAEARKRMMTLGLAVHGDYQKVLAQQVKDWYLAEHAKITARNAEDLVNTLWVILEAG